MQNLPTYTFAIRTLGQSGELFKRELESIKKQTVKPQNVFVYVAEGYKLPEYTDGVDKFIRVKKGMASQRLLDYEEITTDFIFFLDDDVELANDSAEKLLTAAVQNKADCIVADTFHNHEMNFKSRIKNILVNSTFPIKSKKWGQIIGLDGALSYNGNPDNRYYETQSGEGPAWMIKKYTYQACDLVSERWIDELDFAFAEDAVQIFKIYSNGFKCGMLYGSNITHLDGGSSSKHYKNSPDRLFRRSRSIYINWVRMRLSNPKMDIRKRIACHISFAIRSCLIQFSYVVTALIFRNPKIASYHIKGIIAGRKFIKTELFKNLPPYIIQNPRSIN